MFRRGDKVVIKQFWRDWVVCYKQRLVLVFLLMVLVAATGGAYPALIRHVFDVLAAGPERDALQMPSSIWMIRLFYSACDYLFSFCKGVAMYFQVLSVNSLALKVTTDIQKAMAHRLIDADLATVMAEPAGAFVSRIMNDLNLVREAFVRLANNLVRDVLTIFVMVGVMFWFSWLLSVLVLAVYPLAMRPIIQIGNRQRKASGALQEHMETVTSLLAEILQGVRMVKAYQLEAQKRPEVRAHLTAYMNALLIFWPGGPVLTQSLRYWVDLLLPVLLVWRLGRCQLASCRSAMLLASLPLFYCWFSLCGQLAH